MAGRLLQNRNSAEFSARRLAEVAKAAGWPFLICGMRATDTLVVDNETRKLIEGHRPDDGPALLDPAEMADEGVKREGRVFVLLRRGEQACVRLYRKQMPEQEIVSVTYGDASEVNDFDAFLEEHELYVLLGSEASGKRELAELLAVNDMLQAAPVFNAVGDAWFRWCGDFDFVRHAAKVLAGMAAQKKSQHLCLLVSLEQLEQLRVSRAFVPATFKRFANRYGVKCIYFLNRDKLYVASLQYLLSKKGAFSVYEANLSDETIEPPSSTELCAFILNILTNEVRFERFLGNLNLARVVAAEDVSSNPAAVVNMLTAFMETGLRNQVKVPEQTQAVPLPKWAAEMTASYLDDMHEMLSVELNELGSYQPSRLPAD